VLQNKCSVGVASALFLGDESLLYEEMEVQKLMGLKE